MQITGIDPSLTGTGIARVAIGDHSRVIERDVITSRPDGTTVTDRGERLHQLLEQILDHTRGTDLVVIEGPAYSRSNPGTWDRAGLWWLTIDTLLRGDEHPVAIVPPTTLKKYATGKGNATKPDMRMALYRRLHIDEPDDNAVDATWLAATGADWLGQPLATLPAAQRAVLDGAEWPERSAGGSRVGGLAGVGLVR
ncbi:hypothetical protein [Serinicoccus sediminis]|uniref:hypothetical protein n=1 Tax=Serinicoccus sediminis TaxID=2306021 RepID=UPI0010228BB9|nr:hypothetical protein [Serinicoccus sediminis]